MESLPGGELAICVEMKGTTTCTLAHQPSSCPAMSHTPPPVGGERPLSDVSCVFSCTREATRKTSATGNRASRTSYQLVAPWASLSPLMDVREWQWTRVRASLEPLCITTLPISLIDCSFRITSMASHSVLSALEPMEQLERSSDTSACADPKMLSANASTPRSPRWLFAMERDVRLVVHRMATKRSEAPNGPKIAEVWLRSSMVRDAAFWMAGARMLPPGRPRVEPLRRREVMEERAARSEAANLAPSDANVCRLHSSTAFASPNLRCRRSRMTAAPYLIISTLSKFLHTHSNASRIW
mmetsp:Transcript_27945/g.57242  ORF Transcript_27945/g.57242 Transcript_27945/m.57242 type:complete len:299 (+) Transcript_27945:635-1531(+)